MQKPIQFKNNKGQTLQGYVHIPKKYTTAVVFLHGFPSHCKGFTATHIAKSLEKKYLVVRFNFSGAGTSDGKFEDKLMSQEVKDTKYAIDFVQKNFKYKKLILIGHSTGAIDAALYAHKDKRINKLVLMGAVSKLNEAVRYDFTDERVRDFWTKGFVIYKSRKKWLNNKKIKKDFYDEFFKLNIPKAIKKYRRPVLIIHGTEDEAIPVNKDPKELFELCNKPKKLIIIKGANHQFRKPVHWRALIKHIDRFIKK